jgi:hypothetical protein
MNRRGRVRQSMAGNSSFKSDLASVNIFDFPVDVLIDETLEGRIRMVNVNPFIALVHVAETVTWADGVDA